MKNFRSLSYLSEAKRYTNRIVTEETSKDWLVPVPASRWEEVLNGITNDDARSWMKQQKAGRLIHIPSVWVKDVLGSMQLLQQLNDDVNSLLILRQQKDAEVSEDGLLPASALWAPLANETSANHTVHQVNFLAPQQEKSMQDRSIEESVLSYLMSCYQFDQLQNKNETKKPSKSQEKNTPMALSFPVSKNRNETYKLAEALYWSQDLISTPANFLTPGKLQHAVKEWSDTCENVTMEAIVGDKLLEFNGGFTETSYGCGMIYAVGRGAMQEPDREPRLIKLVYNPAPSVKKHKSKHIALIGKGVTFDTGGLNLKPGPSMINMKKDMGGAAVALGLFRALVESEFPVSIHCLIPAVENSVDGTSFRPGDIIQCVNGMTTYIGNTDAEGRLIMADALALASKEKPDMIIDFATLTGAQRVAMGLDIPSVMGRNLNEIIPKIMDAAKKVRDPVWPLPLWEGYRDRLKHKIADLQNVPDSGLAGAITAGLYLSEFVHKDIPWIHVDFNGLDIRTGFGQAQSLRTMNHFLKTYYN